MGQEDRVELGQPDRAQQLLLGPLAAVEQHPVPAGAQQQRRQPAPRRRHRAGGAGEEQGQIHRVGHLRAPRGVAGRSAHELDERERSRPSRAVASAHRVRRRPPPLGRRARVEDVEPVALLVQRQVRVAEHDGVGVGEAAPQPREPAVRRAAVVRHHDPRAAGLDDPHRGQPHAQRPARRRCRARRGRAGRATRAARAPRRATRSPAWRITSAARRRARHASGSARAALGHVRVADDRELSARQEGFEPPTSASGGQRSIH